MSASAATRRIPAEASSATWQRRRSAPGAEVPLPWQNRATPRQDHPLPQRGLTVAGHEAVPPRH